jgi:hypothetical protein
MESCELVAYTDILSYVWNIIEADIIKYNLSLSQFLAFSSNSCLLFISRVKSKNNWRTSRVLIATNWLVLYRHLTAV